MRSRLGAVLLGALLAGPVAARAAPPQKGVALGLWGDAGDRRQSLAEIAALGADHVSLVVAWRQRDVGAITLAPAAGLTVSDGELRATIQAARKAGLRILLFPIIDVEIRRPGEWRGTLHPGDVDAWWQAYEAFILHYAALAADEQAELLSIGSELVTTEAWQERWYHLVSRVRRRYPGKLLYSANWDHFQTVSFWERVDFVGVTAYNELAGGRGASVEELARGWAPVRAALTGLADRVRRPLVVTEIGYPSQEGALLHPWDYTRTAPVDLEEQRRAYAAFVAAWRDEPRLGGVFFWEWSGAGGPADGGYTPRGKPAEQVLRGWYSGR